MALCHVGETSSAASPSKLLPKPVLFSPAWLHELPMMNALREKTALVVVIDVLN
jgi:hypothetical protein